MIPKNHKLLLGLSTACS